MQAPPFFIPYLGQGTLLCLVLLSFLSIFVTLPITKLRRLYIAQVFLCWGALGFLLYAHVTSDFSLLTVVQHSHTQKPLLYKIAGLWGHHEGSLLLWTGMLALVGFLAFHKKEDTSYLNFYSLLTGGFVLFLLMACDPFAPVLEIPAEGYDLNPMLQDVLLAIHPPILYGGYVASSVPFSLGLLKEGQESFEKWYKWSLISWIGVTLGLSLGSFWAYYELGWGGWWFWDPVENLALIPWLLLTALIHTFKGNPLMFQKYRAFLSYGVFGSCLLGLFFTRSGLLNSVHAFALDSKRGIFLGVWIGSLLLWSAWGYVHNKQKNISPLPLIFQWKPLFLIAGIGLLLLGSGIVFLGTIYPLVVEIFGRSLTVGPPYFLKTFIPLMLPLLLFMALYPWLKSASVISLPHVNPSAITTFLLSIFGFILLIWLMGPLSPFLSFIFILALWLFLSSMGFLLAPLEKKSRLKILSLVLGHGGLGISLLGMVISQGYEEEKLVALSFGQGTSIGPYEILFRQTESFQGPNYKAQRAHLVLSPSQVLYPEKRLYNAQNILHNETAIAVTGVSHVYAVMGDAFDNGTWGFRLYHKPGILLIWIGSFMMVLGAAYRLLKKGRGSFYSKRMILLLGVLSLDWKAQSLEYYEHLSSPALENRARNLGDKLLCPTCVGQSLNDSPTEESYLLRKAIRDQLLQGYTDEQILRWFVERYGERILFHPPFSLETFLLWGLPWIVFFILGGRGLYGLRKSLMKKN